MTISPSSFFAEIEAERHQTLLEAGNLKKALWQEPKPQNRWTSLGYFARISVSTCKACNSCQSTLLGVFFRETSPLGLRDTAQELTRFASRNLPVTTETTEQTVPLCAECVDCPVT